MQPTTERSFSFSSASDLDLLFDFLRFRSVSTNPEYGPQMRACAEWLRELLSQGGFAAEVAETGGHPAVMARGPEVPGRPTMLIYGHYDVQPEDPVEQWTSPPFEPTVRNRRVFARGATDNKGQILAHVLGAIHLLRSEGTLPVNLIFLIEGEEEVGSTNLDDFIRARRNELRCDVIAISDTGMVAENYPTLTQSLRGIATMEVIVRGPGTDLHSGIFGGAVANPAAALVFMLSRLHDNHGRVAVPGFYDDVLPPDPVERATLARLPMTDADILRESGAPALAGEAGFTALEQVGLRPTAEINGLTSGYQGAGSKTVLPAVASAKLSFRLVPKQKPDRVLNLVEIYLQNLLPRGVEMEIVRGHGGLPYVVDLRSPWCAAALRALEQTFGREPALVREGGSIPIVQTFHELLGSETLLLGLAAPDCHAHGPNENFPLESFEAGIRLNQALLKEVGANY
ncbi:MAG: dipeptidase [Chthoniobacterales bacterium]|jgi:acetylornithine deacetylase/succinyl-diaminopimelate desuccinylase-like protein